MAWLSISWYILARYYIALNEWTIPNENLQIVYHEPWPAFGITTLSYNIYAWLKGWLSSMFWLKYSPFRTWIWLTALWLQLTMSIHSTINYCMLSRLWYIPDPLGWCFPARVHWDTQYKQTRREEAFDSVCAHCYYTNKKQVSSSPWQNNKNKWKK